VSDDKAVVLLSGGLDSTTVLAMALRLHNLKPENVLGLSLDYGQKHSIEAQASAEVARHYGISWLQKKLDPDIFATDESSLTGNREMPHETYQELMSGDGPSPTYVPFRNANLLSVATAIALSMAADSVYFGAHAEDAHNWAYPDCTPEFIGSMANAIYVGTYHKVRLVTPVEWMMKKDIVALGLQLEVPYQLTHSCYEGKIPACGECPTCVERLQAFLLNGTDDPIAYETFEGAL
jgi:7-cyano-7-deazaguanine synthase